MWTLVTNGIQSDSKSRKRPKQGFFILGHQLHYSFRRSSQWRIVDVLWRMKLVANSLKWISECRPPYRIRERRTFAKQQTFEFVHDNERHEASGVKSPAHRHIQVCCYSLLHNRRFCIRLLCSRCFPTRPGAVSVGRKTVVINHRRGDTTPVFLQVTEDIVFYITPRPDPTSPTSLSRIADNSRAYRFVTVLAYQVRPQDFVNK